MTATPLLSLRGIGKSYGPVVAVREVDLDIFAGEVVAICGDNGAGKSSLIKVISGAEEATSGTLQMRGKTVVFASPHDALSHGVATIYQDLALAPRLSIAQNVFMGSELTRPLLLPFLRVLDKKRMAQEARGFLKQLSVTVEDMDRPVERLSGGQRQAVAISRALRWKAEIIIMDEPTAALGVKETALVLDLIRKLKADGRTVLLISHNMRDVVALADRVVIMGAGRKYVDQPLGDLSADDLSRMIMAGNARAA
ncbi:monosaccharide ABC transporter ATP-binding protein, CUT2 family [Bosea lupini]|uniref:Monosaccharide ABC transporter ATP-binding protein, CUT2 family n=1 Tax=Bosea lupini TaxID=1036779 RepID=A0A1H7QKY0_9HYPH|nr:MULTISPECIES: ATP-binding cassette domain-containing protein [Bosea]SEL48418.1 monosaccharide ABC transporter ATP-binding protein, CUT2 family [Bosea lupini]